MHTGQQVIDLATGIQRRRDFTAHITGFAAGAVVLGGLNLAGVRGGRLYAATLLTWATALSFQHFGHVLRGPVTADAVRVEAARRSPLAWHRAGLDPLCRSRAVSLLAPPAAAFSGGRSWIAEAKVSRGRRERGAESVREVELMFTIRNMGGIALFLFGTTFLWLTPSFASPGVSTTGMMWAVAAVLALATLAGFSVATWGLFRKASWWEGAAVTAAVLGVVVLVPYWLAAHHGGETTPGFNVFIHGLGDAGVFVLLLVPRLEHWVSGHVIAGH